MRQATLTRAVLFVCLCTGFSYAQSSVDLPEAPQPQTQSTVRTALPAAAQVHSAPRPGTLDRSFAIWTALSFAATVADVESTRHAIDACGLREANPFFGRNPSRTRMYATALPITAAQSVLGWYVRKRKPNSRLWMLLPAVNTAAHTAGLANNLARCH